MILKCPETAVATDFKITTAMVNKAARYPTSVQICWSEAGFVINATLSTEGEPPVVSPWTTCNSEVWTEGEVFEFFAAPLPVGAGDNPEATAPEWYIESDVSTQGALFVGLMNRTRGFDGPHGVLDTCTKCNELANVSEYFSPCSSSDDFSASGNPGYSASTDVGSMGWSANLTVPFSAFADFNAFDGAGVPKEWRLNFYRYTYPDGANQNFTNYELTGWSSTHSPTFHVPARFGFATLV